MNEDKFERNAKMFEAIVRGGTFKTVADAEEVTPARVRQIVQKLLRKMMHPGRISGDVVPDHRYWEVTEIRRCADFWMDQLAKLKHSHDQ